MFDLFSQNEVTNSETTSSEALGRHRGAHIPTQVLPSSRFPMSIWQSQSWGGAGVPRGGGPPARAKETLWCFVLMLISISSCYGANVTFPPSITEQGAPATDHGFPAGAVTLTLASLSCPFLPKSPFYFSPGIFVQVSTLLTYVSLEAFTLSGKLQKNEACLTF